MVKRVITHPQRRGIVDSHLDEMSGKMGFGGSCLPKDTLAIKAQLEDLGIVADLFDSLASDNDRLSKEINSDIPLS